MTRHRHHRGRGNASRTRRRGIVRLSGPKVPEVAAVMLGELPRARHVTLRAFWTRSTSDRRGPGAVFPAPHSYTGEHVLELHGHGGPVVIDALVARAVELGARRAHAGEFTQRAFLNDKLGPGAGGSHRDLIDAGFARGAARRHALAAGGVLRHGARAHRSGDRAAHLHRAAIDFPEEEIDF